MPTAEKYFTTSVATSQQVGATIKADSTHERPIVRLKKKKKNTYEKPKYITMFILFLVLRN